MSKKQISKSIFAKMDKHPAVKYFSILLIGIGLAAGFIVFCKNIFNLELVQTGTFINKSEMQRQIEKDFVQKDIYAGLQNENNYLKETINRLKSKDSSMLLEQIKKLELDRDKLIEQINMEIATRSPIFFEQNNERQKIEPETSAIKILKEKLSQITNSIAELYRKI